MAVFYHGPREVGRPCPTGADGQEDAAERGAPEMGKPGPAPGLLYRLLSAWAMTAGTRSRPLIGLEGVELPWRIRFLW